MTPQPLARHLLRARHLADARFAEPLRAADSGSSSCTSSRRPRATQATSTRYGRPATAVSRSSSDPGPVPAAWTTMWFPRFTGAAGGLASPLTAHAHAGGEVVDPGPGQGRVPELRRAGDRPLPGGAGGRRRAGRQPWRAGVGRGAVAECPAV